jgi:hypothetical protein
MTARTLYAAAVVGIAMLGCAGPPEKVGPIGSRCETSSCPIRVFVAGTPPVVSVDIPEMTVPSNNPGAEIVWLLQARDYAFRAGSIRFKGDNVTICNRNFVSHSNARRTYNVTDEHRDLVTCKYEITVYDSAGKPFALDPLIVNN